MLTCEAFARKTWLEWFILKVSDPEQILRKDSDGQECRPSSMSETDTHAKCASNCHPLNLQCPLRVPHVNSEILRFLETFEVGTVEKLELQWALEEDCGMLVFLVLSFALSHKPFLLHTFCHEKVSLQRSRSTGIKWYVLKPLTL